MTNQTGYSRENDEVVLIDGKHYRLMTDAECAAHIWGADERRKPERIDPFYSIETGIWPVELCPVCGWRYAESAEKGCVPDSCSFRPRPQTTAKEKFKQDHALRAGPPLPTVEYGLQEQVADYAHEAWAGWMRHLFEKSTRQDDGTVVIPASLVDRWTRQMHTPYAELPESEKASDRKEARKIIYIIIG